MPDCVIKYFTAASIFKNILKIQTIIAINFPTISIKNKKKLLQHCLLAILHKSRKLRI